MAKRTPIVDVRIVPIAALVPNTWNVNEQTDRTFEAERESIRAAGFVDPVTVRKRGKQYEIIDGEHRWKAAQAEGLKRISVNVVDVDDTTARKLTLMLNTHGEPNRIKLSTELQQLVELLGDDDARLGLPYDETEFGELLKLAQATWPNYQGDGQDGDGDGKGISVLTFHVPTDAVEVINTAIDRMIGDEETTRGVALERICADYLAA